MKQAALLYAPDGDNPGKWVQLSSPTFKGDKGNTVPEIRVFAALREVQLVPNAVVVDGRVPANGGGSPRSNGARNGSSNNFNNDGMGVLVGGGGGGDSVASSGGFVEGLGQSIDAARADAAFLASISEGGMKAYAEGAGAGAGGAGGGGGGGGAEVLHLFSLTTDVRSFKSTRRMPYPTASIVVRLTLPHNLLDAVELGGRTHAGVATPVRTNPPASVARASEAGGRG